MAHKFGEIDYDLKFPNGQQVTSEIDLMAAVMYMWGLDGKQARDKVAAGDFTEQDLQRAIDYWVEKTDGDRHWDESNLKESKLEDYKGYQFYWVTKDPQNGVVEIWKDGHKVMEVPSEKEAEEWVDELDESKRQKKISSILNKILSGADIHSSLMEALEDEDDLESLGKETARILKDITGLTWNYDFEFGDLWCFCTDNIPADVTVSNTDNQWSVFSNDDKVGSFNSLEDAAKKALEIIKKAEDDWVDDYFKNHPEDDPSNISPEDLKIAHDLGEGKRLGEEMKPHDNTEFKYYAQYTASNPTWGGNAEELLNSLGGKKVWGKVILKSEDDDPQKVKFQRANYWYLFPDMQTYDKFLDTLKEKNLNGLITVYKPREFVKIYY